MREYQISLFNRSVVRAGNDGGEAVVGEAVVLRSMKDRQRCMRAARSCAVDSPGEGIG